MTKSEAKERIEKLKKVIDRHRYLYHILNRQEISDAVLDSLKHELYKLEQQFPEFITPNSPTQRVAGKPLEGFSKIEHRVPMLSLEDIFNEEELKNWQNYLQRLEPGIRLEFFSELKIDGFAVALIYKKGMLAVGATRGDGKTGENVTQNLKTIESIPLKLEIHKKLSDKIIEAKLKKMTEDGIIEIRGEVYMEKRSFERFNQGLKKKGEKTYANPRNLAAGSIRQLDPKLTASRPLKFLAYDIVTDLGQKKHSQTHQILKVLGFKTDSGKICQNLTEIVGSWEETAKKRESLPFLIDGIVINLNDNFLFRKLGVIGKAPRGARAFKFFPKQATTIIKDIKLQVGRTGSITPVAHLKPIEVAGVIISKATLHNEDEIKKLEIRIGDTVVVERAGDVIPAVAKVLPELRTGKEKEFNFPKNCPVCGQKLIKPTDEAVWRCLNIDCPARKREILYHFVSKKAFNIVGLGPKIIDQLIDKNLIFRASDIFKLKEEDLVSLPGFAKKKAKNILEAIKKSEEIVLSRFLYALGIRHVGEETAINLANYFSSLNKLRKASKKELEEIPDIGPEASESIFSWFQEKINQNLVNELLKTEVEVIEPEKISKKLTGKTFVFSGGLETITRQEAKEQVRVLGGKVAKSVSPKTDYLVLGQKPGSKLQNAKKLGVKIISEKEFLSLLK